MSVSKKTLCAFAALGAFSAAAAYLLPVYRVQGSSMIPTLKNGDIVLLKRTLNPGRGDIAAFRHEGRVMIKRVAAAAGDTVDITCGGAVLINGCIQIESYISRPDRGICDAPLPLTVPEDHFFVLGDERMLSIDSRSSRVGLINRKDVIGVLLGCIWRC